MSKHVKASEYYSRRVKDDSSESTKSSKVIIENNSDESDTSESFEKRKNPEIKIIVKLFNQVKVIEQILFL